MSATLLPKKPRLPSRPSVGRRAPGAPQSPRSFRGTQAELHPERLQPRWFTGSDLEWLCYDWLVNVRHWKVFGANDPKGPTSPIGVDALFQVRIPAPGYKSGHFRGDIWLLPQGKAGSPGFPYRKGIVWDPLNPWTHKDTSVDRFRKNSLAQGEFLLCWIDADDLYNRRDYVLRLAVKGVSISTIARGVR